MKLHDKPFNTLSSYRWKNQIPRRWYLWGDFAVRQTRCVEPKLQNGKSTVNTQVYLLAMSGWIT